ncbi:PP2C family protein-serine/threonine phosphatase [Streptomyces sp. P9-A2]|uniref:PP2C family protein-serine/threonine phosphatase n=1 Tax=Streptomyces sp. P9-A2 TaxID=3072284 RepID=UPI002FC639FA
MTENPQTLVFPLGMPLVVAVTDGLGGHPGGDVASAMAVRRIASIGPVLSSQDAVRDALNACNRAVCEAAGGDGSELSAMGTTVAGVVVQPGSLLVFNVGNSRVFATSRGGLRQMSVDDSPPLDPGERTTSLVTLCLGGTPVYRPIRPHVTATPVASGDRCLIFTDGLTDLLTTDVLDEVMREYDDGRAAFEPWKAAIAAGGPENITLAVVRVGDEWGTARLERRIPPPRADGR